ncbi:MAG: hypothetical protein AB8B65_12895 [Kordia sp.]|uniref:hypothetical protein n=1 Tax=Kordia sp. TaxID=1965332 RepID=UPI00385BC248
MEMVHTYEKFCKYDNENKIKPDINSDLGWRSVLYLINLGWNIDSRNIFGTPNYTKISRKLLDVCRKSENNFEIAHKNAGIDFWIQG